ncbi:hypothetical protein FCV82_02255 [Vibrio breoganii]|uniref:hypothetical protein n=1 Tax=Vibrio breoganii TaxID=553239 RepID=UPI000C81FEFB|nr:hypothetical protein [Vibrio breoganii]PMN67120.1 hypothetical protein BCT28_03965 [Vibrio breoganii]PMO82903.1 hypothetical protein BCT00_06635 [Vibrio breoganii]TKF90415.1 hypothetical protein FCV82_02255 [Vibrio breoganii]
MHKKPKKEALEEAGQLLQELLEFTASHEIPLIGVLELGLPKFFDNGVAVGTKETHYVRALSSAEGDISQFLINVSKTCSLDELEVDYTFH